MITNLLCKLLSNIISLAKSIIYSISHSFNGCFKENLLYICILLITFDWFCAIWWTFLSAKAILLQLSRANWEYIACRIDLWTHSFENVMLFNTIRRCNRLTKQWWNVHWSALPNVCRFMSRASLTWSNCCLRYGILATMCLCTHTFVYVALLIENSTDCAMENCRPNNVDREKHEKEREGDRNILWEKILR